MTQESALPWVVAAFGLVIGSFLNVCVYRLPRGESIVAPPSRCPRCGHLLAWYENIPVVSYLALRGRCRACRAPISPVYPIVELSTAAIFVVMYLQVGPSLLLVSRLVFGCAMVVLFLIDLRHQILPNTITLPGIAVGFALSLFTVPGWRSSLIGIVAGAGIPLLIAEAYYRIRKDEGLGMGDVKMLGMIGAFLGWKLMLLALVLSSFLGSAVGISIVVAGKGDMKYKLPFGTFLAIGALVASLVGDQILGWYLSFY